MSNATFKKEDYADFRLNLALRKVGQKIFLEILSHAIPKPSNQTYHEHFLDDKNFNYKFFDNSQKEKLKTDPTGQSFDITLMYKLFVHGCPQVYPQNHEKWRTEGEFDYFLGRIKQMRNDLVHASSPIPYDELGEKILHLKNLFLGLLKTAKDRFKIEESIITEKISEINNDLQSILSSPLNQTDVDEYLLTEGVLESKVRYKKLSYVNPVDFFVGVEFSTRIDEIFVTLEIKELESFEEGQRIIMPNLLKSYKNNKISILIVEGLAGSGKTTLGKYILSQWVENSNMIHGLNEFKFVLYLQCNNIYINSVYDLIASIIPETSRRFQKEELVDSVLCQSILIVVDGIDEAHSGTKLVLKELIHRSHGKNIKFFCTSRPEKVHWLYRIKGELSCGAVSIVGVAKEDRNLFVRKLYSYYKTTNLQTQTLCPLSKVIHTLEALSSTAIINDLKLPLFLALFTYLCTVDSSKLSGLNSVVSLYNELVAALKERLLTRSLARNETLSSPLDEDEIEEVMDDCFNIFCEEAFVTLVNDQEILTKQSLLKIKEYSATIDLNVKDILSAFLVVKIVLTPLGIEEIVGFPHKGLKEFLAAKAAARRIRNGEMLSSILEPPDESKSQDTIKKPTQLDLNTGLMKYQNFLLYVAGILSMEGLLSDALVNEILKLFRKAGVYLPSQWLNLLLSLNFHYLACEFILMKFKKLEINESYLDIFIALLKYNCPKEVVLSIDSSSLYHQKLIKVLSLLTEYECNLKLILKQQVKQPGEKYGSGLLNIFNTKTSRCNLNWYEGTANEFETKSLPQSIRVLFLGIGTKQQAEALSSFGENTDILYLKLHIERAVEAKDLPRQLCQVFDLFVFLSGVKSTHSDELWVSDVLARLSVTKKYGKILFPSSELNAKTMLKILHRLLKDGIHNIGRGEEHDRTKGGVYVCSSLINEGDDSKLKAFCHRHWKCEFVLMSDEEIWSQ